MNEEAYNYLKRHKLARIPYISRENSLLFVHRLYKKNAKSVSVSATGVNYFIIEMFVICNNRNSTNDVLTEILKTKPYAVEGVEENSLKVQWKLGS
jgi:hypothetical protein